MSLEEYRAKKSLTMAKKNFAENKNDVKLYLTLSDFHKNWTEAKVYEILKFLDALHREEEAQERDQTRNALFIIEANM